MGVTRLIRSLFSNASVKEKARQKDIKKLTKPKSKQTVTEFVRDTKMLQN